MKLEQLLNDTKNNRKKRQELSSHLHRQDFSDGQPMSRNEMENQGNIFKVAHKERLVLFILKVGYSYGY
jgi:hypothetical protein